MQIKVFGLLKEYFEPTIELHLEGTSILELKLALIRIQPNSGPLLDKCRFACGNIILGEETQLSNIQEIAILPPSSGG